MASNSENSVTIKIKADNSDVKKKGEEVKKTFKELERGPTVNSYKAVAKELIGIEKLAAKVGFNLTNAGKVLSKSLKETAERDVQKLLTATDKYAQHAIQADQKINRAREANDQRTLDRALRQKSRFLNKAKTSAQDANTAQETSEMLSPQAPPGFSRNTRMVGAAIGAAVFQAIQEVPQLYKNPLQFQAQVAAPQIARMQRSFQGDNSDYFMEAKYGALSKAYARARTNATLEQGAQIGGDLLKGGMTAAGTTLATGSPMTGLAVGLGNSAVSIGSNIYANQFQGGRSAAIARLGEENFSAMTSASIDPGLYHSVLSTSGRNVNAMRGLNLDQRQLQSFTNMSNLLGDMTSEESIGLANSLKGTTGSRGATEATLSAGKLQQSLGYNAGEIAGTVGNLSMVDARGTAGANAAISRAKALGLNDTAAEGMITGAAAKMAGNAGGSTDTSSFVNSISQGFSGNKNLSGVEQMKEVQASIAGLGAQQGQINAGGIGQYLQTRIASKHAGGDIVKSMAIQQELSNSFESVSAGTNSTLAALGISSREQQQIAKDLVKDQDRINKPFVKGNDTEAGIRRNVIAGQRGGDVKAAAASTRQRRAVGTNTAKAIDNQTLTPTEEQKRLNKSIDDNQKRKDRSRDEAGQEGVREGELNEQGKIQQNVSVEKMRDANKTAGKMDYSKTGEGDPTDPSKAAIDKSLGNFLKALDAASARINSKFPRAGANG